MTMNDTWLRRALAPVAELREGEARTALMMFAYSFLAMTAYNILKPITRSKFISGLGADNLPYVQLAAGLLIGVLMERYSALAKRVPRRFVIPATLGSMAAVLVAFWVALPDRRRVGVGRLLPARPHPRHPAHQPVLDPGKRHLRPPPGEAASSASSAAGRASGA